MTKISLSSQPKASPEVLFREIEGESVLLNLSTGIYFGLDAVGTKVWQQMSQALKLTQIRDSLLAEYEVDKTCCETELLAFTQLLQQKGLIQITP